MKPAISPESAPRAPAASFRLPRTPKAVVFDLDGTIIDSEALVKDAYFAACELKGLPFTEAQFLSLVGQHREASERKMREYFGPECDLVDFYAAVSAHIGDGYAPLKAGVAELLAEIEARKLPVALATSSGPPWVEKHFKAHGLHPRFRAIVTRMDVANGKPHPEPYLKAAAALGVEPADVVAIEDSPTGFASAHAAGMMTVLIPDLIQPDDALRNRALHVVASLHDVVELVRG
jgi:HAD superfamily hydrolase (TIGR01509 family)